MRIEFYKYVVYAIVIIFSCLVLKRYHRLLVFNENNVTGKINYRKLQKIICFLSLVLLFYILSLFVRTNDYPIYERWYYQTKTNAKGLFIDKTEPLIVIIFWIFSNFGLKFQAFYFIYYLLCLFFIRQSLKKIKDSNFDIFNYLIITFILFMGLVLLRNSFAALLCWIAILCFFEKKYFKTFFLIILATTAHYSSAFLIPIFCFILLLKNLNIKIFALIVIVSLPILYFAIKLLLPLFFTGRYNAYSGTGAFPLIDTFFKIIILTVIFLFNRKEFYKNNKRLIQCLIASFCLIPFVLHAGIFYRVQFAFDIFYFLIFGKLNYKPHGRLLSGFDKQAAVINRITQLFFIYYALRIFFLDTLISYGLYRFI